ncbi:MAG: hypothetical protein IKP88_06355 [Lachnospiraceae bacterium]|nr:hypothetical protein [Lachnospiraceae bacterium]
MWFAYVWIVMIGLLWIIWTLGAAIDVIEQWRDAENFVDFLENLLLTQVFTPWLALHLAITFIASVIYCLHVYG